MITILEKEGREIYNKIDFSKMEGKSVLVTGASGLIGINLIAVLKCIPNIKLLAYAGSNIEILKDLLKENKCEWTGIGNEDLTKSIENLGYKMCDYIIHAACYGQPGKFMENQIKTIQLNTEVLNNLISYCLAPDGKLLFISTSEVYSGLGNPPFSENQIGTTDPFHPRSCYIESKRCGEAICNVYKNSGIAIKIARVSLAYGPGTREEDKRVLNSFIQRAIKDKKITMMDSGRAMRTYSYISDTVENLLNIMLFGDDVVYNVGGNSRLSIADLAREIGSILNVPVVLPESYNELSGAPDDVFLDLRKCEKEFGKFNYVSMYDGLRRTIEYQKKLYNYE